MTGLLDTNFLIALFDAAHVHHRQAHAWMTQHRARGWATCPLTENGCVRIMSQPAYPAGLPLPEIARRLAQATSAPDHRFWADDVSMCDAQRVDPTRIPSPRLVTDVYLLALAVEHSGRLVTFDRGIPLAAVRGATSKHLLTL